MSRTIQRSMGLGAKRRLGRAATVLAVVAGAIAAHGAGLDRNPELKSRALAWTEYDGSYLVDTHSRADMLNFYWTVLARPYPPIGWTGSNSLTTPAAGETSELWRVRNYAQLNAYRALNYSQPMREDPSKLPMVQAGALVLAINPDKPTTHTIDSTWLGYNQTAAEALASSLLVGTGDNSQPVGGAADQLIWDGGFDNAARLGHRTLLLHDGNVLGSVGAARSSPHPYNTGYATLWHAPNSYSATNDVGAVIAYPPPGYTPIALLHSDQDFRWSFEPMSDNRGGASLMSAVVSAKINGAAIGVVNLVRNIGAPLTWEFDEAALNIGRDGVTDGTEVEITVTNVVDIPYQSGLVRNYRYTVTLFDENTISRVAPNPSTPLVNLATRAIIGAPTDPVIAGFWVEGSLPVRVAVRTQGPGLARFGLVNTAKRTRLQVYDATGNLLGENAGWKQHQDWRLLESYGVAPSEEHEAGMVLTLWPGSYTALVTDDTGTNGVGIVEVFNIDNLSPARLSNLSTRGKVGTGEAVLTSGFIIKDTTRTVVVRTQGPGLARFGVQDVVSDTVLRIVSQSDGRTLAENDDWRDGPGSTRLGNDLASFAPADPREAAVVLTLPPGAYTAIVTPKGAPGVGILEVFDLGTP